MLEGSGSDSREERTRIGPGELKGMLSLEQLPCPHKPLRQLSARPGHCPLNVNSGEDVIDQFLVSVLFGLRGAKLCELLFKPDWIFSFFSWRLRLLSSFMVLDFFHLVRGFGDHGWRPLHGSSDALLPTARKRISWEASTLTHAGAYPATRYILETEDNIFISPLPPSPTHDKLHKAEAASFHLEEKHLWS